MSGTSSLQALYKFKAIAIKAAAGVCTEGPCYTTLCCSDRLSDYNCTELHFFTSPSDIIHCAAEEGSAASPDRSTYSLAVISIPLTPTLSKECTVLGTVPACAYIQQKPVLAAETAWPKTCDGLCTMQNRAVWNEGRCRLVFSGRSQLIAGQGRTKSQERERYYRRKQRGEPCSNREHTGLLLQSRPVTRTAPSFPREDLMCSLPTIFVSGLAARLTDHRLSHA